MQLNILKNPWLTRINELQTRGKKYCEEDYLYSGMHETAERCAACSHFILDMVCIFLEWSAEWTLLWKALKRKMKILANWGWHVKGQKLFIKWDGNTFAVILNFVKEIDRFCKHSENSIIRSVSVARSVKAAWTVFRLLWIRKVTCTVSKIIIDFSHRSVPLVREQLRLIR